MCRVGLENEAIRHVEREKRVEKTNNVVFPLAHHVIRTVVRCTVRVRAVDDLEQGEGGGFVRDETCTACSMGQIARAWVHYSQTTLAGAV